MEEQSTGPRQDRRRWLLYESAKLVSLRNLAVAAVIAGGCVAVVGLAMCFSAQRQAPANPAPASSTTPASKSGISLGGYKLIPVTQEVIAMLPEHDDDWYTASGLRDVVATDGAGYPIYSNIIEVERGPGWSHSVILMGEGKRFHHYYFKYKCGHSADTTPDPYRDVMYAEPQVVADDYASERCSNCRRAKAQPGQQPATPDRPPPAAPAPPGAGG